MNYQQRLQRFIELANEGKSKNEIAEIIGVNRRAVLDYEKKTGIKTVKLVRKPNFNYHYFDEIDTEEKAYILGFIFADGYFESNERCLTFNINKRDIDLFDKIRDELLFKGEYAKSSTKNCIRLHLSSIHTVSALKKHGLSRNKTHKLKMPVLREDLYKHFLRGYFDGDGHVGKRQCTLVIGSKDFLDGFLSFMQSKFNNKIYFQKMNKYYRVQFNRRDHNIIDWLYEGANISLDRKMKSYVDNWENYTERIRSRG